MNRSLLFASSIIASLALTPAYADSPREFLHHALQGDNSEIMLGRMASDQARSPAVRDFAQTLVSDHRQARQEVRELGGRFGLDMDREPSPEARDEQQRLYGLRGRDFDREFVRYMVDDHRKDIADFRSEANEHHGPVSDLARNQLPTLGKHLRMAIALQRSDGRSSEGGWDMARDRGEGRGYQDRGYQGDNQSYRGDNDRDNRNWNDRDNRNQER